MPIPTFLAMLALAVTAARAAEDPFPTPADLAQAKPGDLVVRPSTYQGQACDWGLLVVPEDPDHRSGKLIQLPVMRIRARGQTGLPPVFYLFGGPGATNIHTWWPESFYADHDFVQVGYRGVDGSVRLDVPEVDAALRQAGPLEPQTLQRAGQALAAGLSRLRQEGIDLDRYTMLDVVADLEAARKALGYGKINLLSHSYGTQVASLYCMAHPGSISRNLMVGASAPGHATVWEPAEVDQGIRQYAHRWAGGPAEPGAQRSVHAAGGLRAADGNLLPDG